MGSKGRLRVHTLPSSQVKTEWHAWLERVERERAEVVVTRYGRPVARLVPADVDHPDGVLHGYLAGTLTECGDVEAPLAETWDADG